VPLKEERLSFIAHKNNRGTAHVRPAVICGNCFFNSAVAAAIAGGRKPVSNGEPSLNPTSDDEYDS